MADRITCESLRGLLPPRRRDSHKGDYGRDLLVCGSVGYTGAACLAAEAAVRGGAGLVFLGVPQEIYDICAVKCTEAMPFPLPCSDGRLAEPASAELLRREKDCDAVLLGPGLGRGERVSETVFALLRGCRAPLVLDADGINAAAGNIDILDETSCPLILTPHEGEFARLGGDLAGGREAGARAFARRHGCTLILKGAGTVVALPDGRLAVNTTGNPGMARGGSGDVLAGLLCALLGQGLAAEDAARAAVWLHGRAGDICAAALGEYCMTPSDIIRALPEAFREIAPGA